MTVEMKYREALDYMDSLTSIGIVPGLDSIGALCGLLNHPQDSYPVLHIAGTNGKGSVLAYLSTVLKYAGYRVGRYSSPAVFDPRECIQVNEKNITQKAFGEGMELIREKCLQMTRQGQAHPSLFEVQTALAFWYFREKKCDIVVLETGMGGLLDATNIVRTTLAAVITSIGRDHMQFLGNGLEEIAAQKAGIIKEGCNVICMRQEDAVLSVIKREAEKKHAAFLLSDAETAVHQKYGLQKQSFDYKGYKKLEISLAGKYQIDNAVLAVDTLSCIAGAGFPTGEEALRKGLRETVWEGRFTKLDDKPLFLADGAHNEDAAKKLADSIEFYFTNRRIIYIIGMLRDKEYEKVIALTHKYADQIITITPPNHPRAMNGYELAQAVAKVHAQVTAVDSLEEAVEMSRLLAGKEDVILAFGSLSYLGRLTEIVRKHSGSRKDKRSGKAVAGGHR